MQQVLTVLTKEILADLVVLPQNSTKYQAPTKFNFKQTLPPPPQHFRLCSCYEKDIHKKQQHS